MNGKMENAYKIVVRRPEDRRPLGRPGSIWDSNIKTGLKEQRVTVWSGVDCLSVGFSGGIL
jgi:hypothetical protein